METQKDIRIILMELIKSNTPEFCAGGVPVSVAAKAYGKDADWVKAGIIAGWLPIGKATRNGELITSIEQMNSKYGRINYYISPRKLWEETGFIYKEGSR